MDIIPQQDALKALYNEQNPKTYQQLSALFEQNYQLVLSLIPALKQTTGDNVIKHESENDLCLFTQEITPYTATYTLTHQLDMVNRPDIKFRVYFDARLVEVISVCDHTMLSRNHPYLAKCSDIDIQWELNMFLERWLDYCLDKYKGKSWQIM